MTEFWLAAGAMLAAAVAFLLWPAWRAFRESGAWPFSPTVVALLLIPVAVVLYRNVSTWPADAGATVGTPEQFAIVEQLAQRMQDNPDDVDGWMLLGRSYLTLERYLEARQAFMQAWQRTPAPGNVLKLGLGISMIHSDRASIGSDGGQLIEEVLQSEPNNPQALWYGGLVALERGRPDQSVERWQRLLAMNPSAEVADILRQQIAMLGNVARAAPLAGGTPSVADGPVIELEVSIGEDISTANLGPNAALFIFARAEAGGPPLAVIREPASAVPGRFTLSNANTMIQGNSLENFEELTLVARLSASGQPTAASGDIYAESVYALDQAGGEVVELILNQVVP